MYIVSPMTSGEPSWPRSTPVDIVHATCSLPTLLCIDLLQITVAVVGIVAGLRGPVRGIGDLLIEIGIGKGGGRYHRCSGKYGSPH